MSGFLIGDVSLFELFYRGDGEGFAVYGEFDFVACEGEAVGALGVINVGRARVLGKDFAKDFSLIFGQCPCTKNTCLFNGNSISYTYLNCNSGEKQVFPVNTTIFRRKRGTRHGLLIHKKPSNYH